jgi:hypothetical protein
VLQDYAKKFMKKARMLTIARNSIAIAGVAITPLGSL